MIARRSLLRAMIAAPFIVKAASLMPVRAFASIEDYVSPPVFDIAEGLDLASTAFEDYVERMLLGLTSNKLVISANVLKGARYDL